MKIKAKAFRMLEILLMALYMTFPIWGTALCVVGMIGFSEILLHYFPGNTSSNTLIGGLQAADVAMQLPGYLHEALKSEIADLRAIVYELSLL